MFKGIKEKIENYIREQKRRGIKYKFQTEKWKN